MKILITGASGFIGRNLKEYLESRGGYKVYAPTSRELDCLDEIQVKNYLEKKYLDFILHCAVYGDVINKSKDATKVLDYNLRFFLNFAKCAHLYGKMYYTGSGAEYDKRHEISMVKEDEVGKTVPVDQYGLMKYVIGQMIESSKNIYNFRLFGIFGKYEYYPRRFISNVCCKAIKGLPLTIRQNVYFDYLWVEDFARMVEHFLHHVPKHHTYNMVSGKPVSLQEICEYVLRIRSDKLPVYICREGVANTYTASNERFIEECCDFMYTPIDEAIASLYKWYEEHSEEIDLYKLIYG